MHKHAHLPTRTHTPSHKRIQVQIRTYVHTNICKFVHSHTHTHTHTHTRIYIRGAFNRFPAFFVQDFKIGVDSWKSSMLLLYILWDDWLVFMISDSKEQLQQQLEYILQKPYCHSWWISKMQFDTLEEWYAIKFYFRIWKNATETYGML